MLCFNRLITAIGTHSARCGKCITIAGQAMRPVLLKQLRGELVQIVPPVDPGVPAGTFAEERCKAVLLQHLDGGFGGGNQWSSLPVPNHSSFKPGLRAASS